MEQSIASTPSVRILRPSRTLHTYDAESLPGRSLHDHPTFQTFNDRCAERFQTSDFSWDVICFDVQVNSAGVLDTLYLHDGLIGWRRQHSIVAASAWVLGVYRPT